MRLGILGPLLVTDDAGQEISVAAARQRTVLATLLVRANRTVPVDELAEIVWDGAPPDGAAYTVRSYVMRLRRAVGPAIAARISTRQPGYLCEVAEEELDVLRFEALCRATGAALGAADFATASASGARAIALWRGTPLLDVPSRTLRDECVPRFEQHRLQVLEHRIEAELRLDQHDRLVPELWELTARYPLRERFHAQLMLALARSGRQAEALEAYRTARRTLIDELGIEPGAELRDLHAQLLAGESTRLAAPRTEGAERSDDAERGTTAARAPVVPRQLPAAVRQLAGRTDELKTLTARLGRTEADGRGMVISAIEGTAGVGKTALAVHWAHRHADQFPDGQLYVNLRGFDPSGPPVAPAAAVRRILDALAVPAEHIPDDPDAQFDLYRSLLADRCMLIILDNARTAEQVRPLLPGAAGCRVLVTSRNRLTSLIALDGATPLTIGLLTRGEARELLAGRLGAEQVAGAPEAVDELIEACARLPLALNIAAARAATRPNTPLATLAAELRDARRRLDVLTAGQGAADVRAVFSWSYHELPAAAARLFCLLGGQHSRDISLPAAASLAGLDRDAAGRALDELTSAHLLTEPTPGRYAQHDLLRAYATERAGEDLAAADRTAALRRLVDFYLHTGYAAERLLDPLRVLIELTPPAEGCRPEPLPDAATALRWLTAESPNLLAAQELAATHGWHTAVWQLAWALDTFHYRRSYLRDRITCWQAGLAAAEKLADAETIALAHRRLGLSYGRAGEYTAAHDHLTEALDLAERAGDTLSQLLVHDCLAWTWSQRDDYQRALTHATPMLHFAQVLGSPKWQAQGLNSIGWYRAHLGDYAQAREACERALTLARELADDECAAYTLDSLGYIAHHTGRHAESLAHYREALTRYRGLGDTYNEADTVDRVGDAHAASGSRAAAREAWRQARDLYQEQHRRADADRVQGKLADQAGS